jgi:hypothetical protein
MMESIFSNTLIEDRHHKRIRIQPLTNIKPLRNFDAKIIYVYNFRQARPSDRKDKQIMTRPVYYLIRQG